MRHRLVKVKPVSISKEAILESIDREIDYYRHRNHWLNQYSLVAVPVIFAAQIEKGIPLGNVWVEAAIFSTVYLALWHVCRRLQYAMRERIYHLFAQRERLLSDDVAVLLAGRTASEIVNSSDLRARERLYVNPLGTSDNPSKVYLFALGVICAICVIATLARALQLSPI